MTATPVDVPEAMFTALRRHFNDEQMIELTATIAWENYRARFDHALAIEAQGFSEGAYCVLPERPKRPGSRSDVERFSSKRMMRGSKPMPRNIAWASVLKAHENSSTSAIPRARASSSAAAMSARPTPRRRRAGSTAI